MSTLKEQINIDNLPSHVAIIMDGNGRWAKKQGKLRLFGHNNGVSSVRAVTEVRYSLRIFYRKLEQTRRRGKRAYESSYSHNRSRKPYS